MALILVGFWVGFYAYYLNFSSKFTKRRRRWVNNLKLARLVDLVCRNRINVLFSGDRQTQERVIDFATSQLDSLRVASSSSDMLLL